MPTTLWSLAAVALVLACPSSAEAYIDPGNASYLFQLIAGGVLGALFLLRTWWHRIVAGVRATFSRGATSGR